MSETGAAAAADAARPSPQDSLDELERNKAVLRRLYELFNTNSLDGLDDLAGPDLAAMLRGAIPRARQAFPDAPWVVHDLIAERDTVVMLWSRTGTHGGSYQGVEATGRPIVQKGARVFRLEDGKAVETAAYGNDLEVMRQIGAMPSPSATRA
ncbi:MAG: hypothetical protein AVDCRST_MAG77-1174 [uncultured Chloroflexi bacterium]|uniref:Ester cyclase n=1 Tax=uncultured Chloroflexota bacterium TaxID=166587 RepID=A0A6J4HR34_9CHLR|nr:MAG: hypothetical protein AVDCRST_MAG77-1174 [uncultured Chloroflexota bacterium]